MTFFSFQKMTLWTYPWVAESHADSGVDRHTEVTLWPLHIQGEVSGEAHRKNRTEQQEKKPGWERHHVSSIGKCWTYMTRKNKEPTWQPENRTYGIFNAINFSYFFRMCPESPAGEMLAPAGLIILWLWTSPGKSIYDPQSFKPVLIFNLWPKSTKLLVYYVDDMN